MNKQVKSEALRICKEILQLNKELQRLKENKNTIIQSNSIKEK